MTDTDYATVCSMRDNGGGFVRRLAEAAFAADPANLERLKAAFPEYWEKYMAVIETKAPAAETCFCRMHNTSGRSDTELFAGCWLQSPCDAAREAKQHG